MNIFHIDLLQNCNIWLKKTENKVKEAEVGPFLKVAASTKLDCFALQILQHFPIPVYSKTHIAMMLLKRIILLLMTSDRAMLKGDLAYICYGSGNWSTTSIYKP